MTTQAAVAVHPVLAEEAEWERATEFFLGARAELVSVSRWIGDSRVYRRRDRAAVIRSVGHATADQLNSLQTAAGILRRLGREAEFVSTGHWEALKVPWTDGVDLERRLSSLSVAHRARLLVRLVPVLAELHRRGIAHRDLRPNNVVVEPSGAPRLIDFDRSVTGDRWTAALADWLGIGPAGLSPNPYWKFALFTLAPHLQSVGRRLRCRLRQPNAREQDLLPADLRLLAQAWAVAECSASNAPGQRLAYYALTYKGHHFPGERPWYLRWETIRRNVALEGKRVLDLGSNLGLLPIFALLHGAESATAVDRDADILDAAQMVARAFGVSPRFRRIDLTGGEDWEAALAGDDIVAVLSLLHWLPNEKRLLDFLGSHPEVIFEGHDRLDVELARLRAVGFKRLRVLGETERGRFVIHGRKP